jgi:hypothetical protein
MATSPDSDMDKVILFSSTLYYSFRSAQCAVAIWTHFPTLYYMLDFGHDCYF